MGNAESSFPDDEPKPRSFPGSAIIDTAFQCGNLDDSEDSPYKKKNAMSKFFNQADVLCASSPSSDGLGGGRGGTHFDGEYEEFRKDMDDDDDNIIAGSSNRNVASNNNPANPTSALFARALVNEVTNNPNTMTPAAMAERETKLLKAQNKARQNQKVGGTVSGAKPVGAPGGIGQPSVLGSIAHALTGTTDPLGDGVGAVMPSSGEKSSVLPPNSMSENRAQVDSNLPEAFHGKHTVTIGLSLTRRSSSGHPDTVTRQTAFDFNELQDRDYKYVSSTDSSGWRAGGGERGGQQSTTDFERDEFEGNNRGFSPGGRANGAPAGTPNSTAQNYKVAATDSTHIPIIHIDCDSPQQVDAIIAALARGEVFIPHMAIIPEALSVNGVSPPDLVVRFGTERNDDLPPDEWPNWCLEFMHNQLYEYFQGMGARWMKRPFSITLAKKVRWKTVKHMNRYFAHAERVIDAWREKGPQYLDPQLAYIEGGATPEEVSRPHGIYLLRNGVPTNYFAPNFDPPYTTKMTRSLLLNVLGKSWDKKRREWTSAPMPRLITPSMLVTAMCGCADNSGGGFMANEVTLASNINTSNIPDGSAIRSEPMTPARRPPTQRQQLQAQPEDEDSQPEQRQQQQQKFPQQLEGETETDIVSEPVYNKPGQMKTPSQQSEMRSTYNKADQMNTPSQQSEMRNSYDQRRPMNTPSQQSELRGSFEERRPLDPDDEINQKTSPTSGMSGKPSSKDDDDELDLILSSTGSASKSKQGAFASPKYGRAPTPERVRMLNSSPGKNQMEADEMVDTGRTARTPDPAETEMNDSINSRAPSDYGQTSLAGTGTTVMHMNLSAEKFVKREMDRRQELEEKKEEDVRRSMGAGSDGHGPLPHLSSDEDWLDNLGQPIRSPSISAHNATTPSAKNTTSLKDSLAQERERNIAMVAMAEERKEQSSAYLPQSLNDSAKTPVSETSMASERARIRKKVRTPSIHKTDSGTVSLEYSVDSNSIMENSYMGDSSALASLMGQHYATDTSVVTATSATTKGSGVQQPNLRQTAAAIIEKDEEDVDVSIQESTSSMEVVPSDEDLFAVGWAKALDPNSGSYYYFTLDRSKIVWENPISATGASADSTEDGSGLRAGVAEI